MMNCPKCKSTLYKVIQASPRMLNSYQFDAVKAGDWYCEECPDNGRGKSGLCYFWDSEVGEMKIDVE